MERNNRFFSLGKTLAAGALTLAMVPGVAFATATYDVSAFASLFVEDAPVGVTSSLVGAPIVNTSSSITGQHATADFNPNPPMVFGFNDGADHMVGVLGSANGTGADPFAFSFASVESQSNLLLENVTGVEQEVAISLGYSASWALALGRPLDEIASAQIEIILLEVGGTAPLLSILIDPIIPDLNGQWPSVGDLPPEFIEMFVMVPEADPAFGAGQLGLQLTVNVLGSAESVHVPGPGVPVPATLALLALGFISLAARRQTLV